MIMIAFNNFNLLASFPRKLLRLFRQGITTKQRISAPFWMYALRILSRKSQTLKAKLQGSFKVQSGTGGLSLAIERKRVAA
jgi:hypothetical protein